MNANARKWVAALRSGEFKRGSNWRLRDGDAYSAFGLACELYRREAGCGEWRQEEDPPDMVFVAPDGAVHWFTLPFAVFRWLGLADLFTFVWLDDDGWSFDQIADLLESEPDGLFVEEPES